MPLTLTPRRTRILWIVALLFTLLNVAGACMAAVAFEAMHFSIHLVLALVAAPFVWALAPSRRREY